MSTLSDHKATVPEGYEVIKSERRYGVNMIRPEEYLEFYGQSPDGKLFLAEFVIEGFSGTGQGGMALLCEYSEEGNHKIIDPSDREQLKPFIVEHVVIGCKDGAEVNLRLIRPAESSHD